MDKWAMPSGQILVRSDAVRYHCFAFLAGIQSETSSTGATTNHRPSPSLVEFIDAPALS